MHYRCPDAQGSYKLSGCGCGQHQVTTKGREGRSFQHITVVKRGSALNPGKGYPRAIYGGGASERPHSDSVTTAAVLIWQ